MHSIFSLILALLVSLAVGQLPCGFPDNSTNSAGALAIFATPVVCTTLPVTFIAPHTRLCNQVVAAGTSVFYAVVISNNVPLSNLQFGISVTPKNISTTSSNGLAIFSSTNACPNVYCPIAQNPFGNINYCNYDHTVSFGSAGTPSSPLQINYMNTADGVYYIMVQGPYSGAAILFDIEINDGSQTLAKYVPVITVLLFTFLFSVIIALIGLWKKTHGGWKRGLKASPSVVADAESQSHIKGVSNTNLLRVPSTSMAPQSLENVVSLFKDQVATISKFTEASANFDRGSLERSLNEDSDGEELKGKTKEKEEIRTDDSSKESKE